MPRRYTDTRSGTSNDVLTPGGMGWLQGGRMALDPAAPRQGAFFLDEAGVATRVPVWRSAHSPAGRMGKEL